jgi:hypothetical protein
MRLTVIGRYRSSFGSYEPGQELSLSDADAEFLLRDSPTSFALAGSAPAPAQAGPATSEFEEEEEDDFDPGAMSTETASGLVVPDRRARGGRRRTSG